ncbi:MAG: TolC family protein [Ferruginibacter sp.]|nr:TolC family protein [Cytophagales bacterium]
MALLLAACTSANRFSRSYVSQKLEAQSGFTVLPVKSPASVDLPPTVVPTDGLTEDEAVALALWNNAQFQTDLAAIAIARADVIDAGVVANPLLRYLSPNAGIVASGYLNFALDFIWQRPQRVAAARYAAERTASDLLQRSFTLIRDVQVAYADLLLAREKAVIFARSAQVRVQLNELAESRLRNGDISELEASVTRADAASARDDLLRASLDTLVLANRFNTLLGFASPDTVVALQPAALPLSLQQLSKAEALELAYAMSPPLQAAATAIEAGGKRLGWEKSRIISFTATLGFQHIPTQSPEGASPQWMPNAFNPGIQAEIPVFNRNQGKVARAEAEMEQAVLQYVAVRQQITLGITEAYNRYQQMHRSYQVWNTGVLPSLESAVALAGQVYQRGDISYLPVLDATRQLLNGQLRRAEVAAELRRSVSQLNYSMGKKAVLPQ